MDQSSTSGLADVVAGLYGAPDVERTLQSILEHAMALTRGDGVAVMLCQAGRPAVTSATSPAAAEADRVQVRCAEGPGLQAMSLRDAVVVDDVAADPRWRSWGRPVRELGFRSVLSLSLGTGRSSLGALSVYSSSVGAFVTGRAELVRCYAQHASVALMSARHESGLRRAIDARHVIGQAQGLLMERHGLDTTQAFAMLRTSARNHGVKLSVRAEQVVASRPADVG